jgi:hypothetical protein
MRGQVMLGEIGGDAGGVPIDQGIDLQAARGVRLVQLEAGQTGAGGGLKALRPVTVLSNEASALASGITLRISQQPSGS